MIYRFGPYELDMAKVELRAAGTTRDLEPQVFALLALLVENHDRLVSKDEIFEKVWDGRIVSDAALASRVKSARQAVGDNGKSQGFIRTVHRQGFRFVANVRTLGGAQVPSAGKPLASGPPRMAASLFTIRTKARAPRLRSSRSALSGMKGDTQR